MSLNDPHIHHPDRFVVDGVEELRDILVIEGDKELLERHIGGICVHEGATFTIPAHVSHIGSITFRAGSTGSIGGYHQGRLRIESTAEVEVWGSHEGAVKLAPRGEISVQGNGRIVGTVSRDV